MERNGSQQNSVGNGKGNASKTVVEADLHELDKRLRAKATLELSKEEMRDLRVNLAMGMLPTGSTTTREKIEEVIDSGRA